MLEIKYLYIEGLSQPRVDRLNCNLKLFTSDTIEAKIGVAADDPATFRGTPSS